MSVEEKMTIEETGQKEQIAEDAFRQSGEIVSSRTCDFYGFFVLSQYYLHHLVFNLFFFKCIYPEL